MGTKVIETSQMMNAEKFFDKVEKAWARNRHLTKGLRSGIDCLWNAFAIGAHTALGDEGRKDLAYRVSKARTMLHSYCDASSIAMLVEDMNRVVQETAASRTPDREAALEAMKREIECGTLVANRHQLCFIIRDVVCGGCALGSFRFTVGEEGSIRVVPVDAHGSRRYAGENSDLHPHINCGSMCFGEFGGAVRNAMATFDISRLIDLCAQAISTYNPQSCYRTLADLGFVLCDKCGADGVDISKCESCGNAYCEDCEGAENICCSCIEDDSDC